MCIVFDIIKIISVAPALHRNTVSVNTGELVLAAAGQGEQDLVGGVGGARARVVVNLNGETKEEEESNRPLGGAQQPGGLAGPVGRHHVRVSDVGGDPEVRARVVDYARQTEANVLDPALVVVDRSEQVLESGVSAEASQPQHGLGWFFTYRAHSAVSVAGRVMNGPLPIAALVRCTRCLARVAGFAKDATPRVGSVRALVVPPVGEVYRLPCVVVRPGSVPVEPVGQPVEIAPARVRMCRPFHLPLVVGLQLHGCMPVEVEQLLQSGVVRVGRDLASMHPPAEALVVVKVASLGVDKPLG